MASAFATTATTTTATSTISAQDRFELACGHCTLIDVLFIYEEGGIDVHRIDDFPFITACEHGNLAVAKWLVSLGGVEVDTYGNEPLCGACRGNHVHVVEWLTTVGVDIHMGLGGSTDSAFREACDNDSLATAMFLLAYSMEIGSPIDPTSAFVQTCRRAHRSGESSSETDHKNTVEWLILVGADVKTEESEGLCWALLHGHREVAKVLMEHYSPDELAELMDNIPARFGYPIDKSCQHFRSQIHMFGDAIDEENGTIGM
jgi:hypothetical protein